MTKIVFNRFYCTNMVKIVAHYISVVTKSASLLDKTSKVSFCLTENFFLSDMSGKTYQDYNVKI